MTYKILFFLLAITTTPNSLFSDVLVKMGPASLGGGGPNPLSIPPNFIDLEFSYITPSNFEWNFSISPGITAGQKYSLKDGYYLSLGPALGFNKNDLGIGGYTALGMEFCMWLCFTLEYKQVIAFRKHLISPYALRIGVIF